MLKILITVLEILCKWTKSDKKMQDKKKHNTQLYPNRTVI